MSEDANQIETQTETNSEATASQPDQGSDTQAAAQATETGSAQQVQGAQQQPQTIPKWRFDEINAKLHEERQARYALQQQYQQPAAQAPQAPKQEEYSTYEDYIRAEAKFTAEKAADDRWSALQTQHQQATQRQAEQARIHSAETNWDQKSYEATAKYPDFEQKVSMSAPLTNPFAVQVLKASAVAGDLAYHLASNPDVVGRLNGMHPMDAAAELGRIEGKLQGSTGQPVRKPSSGIPALNPVGAGSKHGAVDPYALDTSVEDYVRLTRSPPRKR